MAPRTPPQTASFILAGLLLLLQGFLVVLRGEARIAALSSVLGAYLLVLAYLNIRNEKHLLEMQKLSGLVAGQVKEDKALKAVSAALPVLLILAFALAVLADPGNETNTLTAFFLASLILIAGCLLHLKPKAI